MSPFQLRLALCWHRAFGKTASGSRGHDDTPWAEAAELCFQPDCCCPWNLGWPCCSGVDGIADSLVKRLPKIPIRFTVGLGHPGAAIPFEDYSQMVRVLPYSLALHKGTHNHIVAQLCKKTIDVVVLHEYARGFDIYPCLYVTFYKLGEARVGRRREHSTGHGVLLTRRFLKYCRYCGAICMAGRKRG
jgi:hypothetical protein